MKAGSSLWMAGFFSMPSSSEQESDVPVPIVPDLISLLFPETLALPFFAPLGKLLLFYLPTPKILSFLAFNFLIFTLSQ